MATFGRWVGSALPLQSFAPTGPVELRSVGRADPRHYTVDYLARIFPACFLRALTRCLFVKKREPRVLSPDNSETQRGGVGDDGAQAFHFFSSADHCCGKLLLGDTAGIVALRACGFDLRLPRSGWKRLPGALGACAGANANGCKKKQSLE